MQFYIIVYHFCDGCTFGAREGEIVDRFMIDLELSRSPDITERRRYSGRMNIAQFDLSFRVDGECAEDYYGPQCNVFCYGVAGQSTCDSEGNLVCVEGGDPDNNCIRPTGTFIRIIVHAW